VGGHKALPTRRGDQIRHQHLPAPKRVLEPEILRQLR
jgi:hypothetical protein